MEIQQKKLLGRILGEVFRTQIRTDPKMCGEGPAKIYGLLHGIEAVIDEYIDEADWIPQSKVDAVVAVLSEYHDDNAKLASLKGYDDFEPKLEKAGVTRSEAMIILSWFWSDGRFFDVLKKLDTQHSPSGNSSAEYNEPAQIFMFRPKSSGRVYSSSPDSDPQTSVLHSAEELRMSNVRPDPMGQVARLCSRHSNLKNAA